MKKSKKLKQILSCIALAVISLIFGYTIFIPNEKTDGKNSPLAVMLGKNGSYTQSIIKDFDEILEDYTYDHIDCGSAVENAKWSWNDGTLSASGINSHTTCKLYFNEIEPVFKITSITVDGTSVSSVPTQMKYYVVPTCTGSTATWNYATWSLDVTSTNAKTQTCSLAFTTITSSNLASKFTSSAGAGKYLNTYIKSLLNGGTSVSAGASSVLRNEGTTTGTLVNNGTADYYHDIGIRYEGANPDNYIKFNNELWRIIGIFREAKTTTLSDSDTYYTKIIRNESIGSYAYNGVSGYGGWWSKSNGSVSTLNYLLNHYYIGDEDNYDGTGNANCKFYSTNVTRNCDYRVIGIQPGWRDMIINTTWYTAAGVNSSTASTSFSGERSSKAGKDGGELSYKDTTTNKYSKVGLMYPSDYLYSGSETSTRWLLQNAYEWTISPNSSTANYAWIVDNNGSLGYNSANGGGAARPTVYLASNVYITGGSGTMLDPYIINGG